jgi:hypothetical protein
MEKNFLTSIIMLRDILHNSTRAAIIYLTSYFFCSYQCNRALLSYLITVILKGRVTHLVITPPKFLSSRLPPLLDLYLHHIKPHNNTNVNQNTQPCPRRPPQNGAA